MTIVKVFKNGVAPQQSVQRLSKYRSGESDGRCHGRSCWIPGAGRSAGPSHVSDRCGAVSGRSRAGEARKPTQWREDVISHQGEA